jgi:hypothetical protein
VGATFRIADCAYVYDLIRSPFGVYGE